MEIVHVIESLRKKRLLFHSEADFQFSLAWEIQLFYPTAEIRLEYPSPENDSNKHIDILVRNNGLAYPIELKYKTKKLSAVVNGEEYHLKNHGAQDNGVYDFVKDLCRIEFFAPHLDGFKCGYALWLTNENYYWKAPTNPNAGHAAFSVHDGAKKTGIMSWGAHLSSGTIKGREKELQLMNEYCIGWNDYSNLEVDGGAFKYALIQVGDCSSNRV